MVWSSLLRAFGLFLPFLTIVSYVVGAPRGEASRSPEASAAPGPGDPVEYGRPNLRVFTDKDGLPQNAITSLVFDRKGYLWAGTKDGAARYDGRTWTVVNLPAEIGTNSVTALLVASDGSLWFGTGDGGGVARLQNDQWIIYNETNGLPGNSVTCLLESVSNDGRPVVMVGTTSGLARFEDGQWRHEVPIPAVPDTHVVAMLESNSPDGGRVLWVGLLLDGVARLQGGVWTVFDRQSGLPARGVTCFAETTVIDGRRLLVAGTFDEGILVFDGAAWRPEGTLLPPINRGAVQCFLQTRTPSGATILWAGTSTGLCRFEGGRWLTVGSTLGMPATPIWSLARIESAAGTIGIFVGTAGLGLVHWQLGQWAAFDTATGMAENSVYGLLVTKADDGSRVLWVGTNSRGLSRLEQGTWAHHNGPAGYATVRVNCLAETRDADGRRAVWVGTHKGLLRLKSGQWTVLEGKGGAADVVNTLIRTTASDGTETVLVGTNGGIFRVESDEMQDLGVELRDERVGCLLETRAPDGSRILWAGGPHGLTRFERGVTTVYDKQSGLPSDQVSSLYERRWESGARVLWVGTTLGLAMLNLDAPAWTYLSTETTPALPNNTIYRIEEDAWRRVYLFTNKGVARLTPGAADNSSPFDIYTFTTEDGLPSNECNTGSSTMDDLGRIWAGTIGGVAMFDPAREVGDTTPKPLVVERAFLPDQGRALASGDSLAHDENHVLFEFALLSYFRGEETQYRAQLVGFDDEPSEWSVEPKRDYISLPPGEYRFAVWGRDALGNVSGPVEVPFAVRRAPWLTWWAMILYVVAGICAAYAAFRYRVGALQRHNERLEAGIAERTTQLAHTVEDLRESEQRALEANRAKSVFLANMSHELRTPLNAILGFAQLIERDDGLDRAHRESLGIIARSGEHLLGLINDVLSIAKIEAGKIEIVEQTFDLHDLLRTVREMIRIRAQEKGLTVELVLDPALPVVVRGDVGKLRQVLVNLLGNAVKFTERGGVTLRASWREGGNGSDAPGRITFDVVDTGCGLTERDLARLFEAFVQTEGGQRAQEGTGLGLVISRNFVRLMGGDIHVASTPGVGTTFTFDVALRIASHVERRATRRKVIGLAPDSPPGRILVVDDTPENRLLLVRLLTEIGFDVREATNGAEAVDAWQSWGPDLIFMDMRMPVMDGLEATRRIRNDECRMRNDELKREAGDKHSLSAIHHSSFIIPHFTKIIALTASALEHEQDRFLGAGCDDYIPKPFKAATILERIAEHLGVRYVYEEGAPIEPAEPSGDLPPARLMALPGDLLEALRSALTLGDTDAALEAVDRVRAVDGALADDLAARVKGFRFEEILASLESTNAHE
jgi:signal transduction histidine kinase/CheY-like chemotaxis protein/ligand-binding sensor domain-containing protein